MNHALETAAATAAGPTTASRYRWFVAAVLSLAYTVAFIDRQVFNLLVDPIKHTLALSDTQVSLLQGAAFVIAYIAMGPVFGVLVDRRSRKLVIVFGVSIWCVSTVLCGLANDFWSLLLARAGVGGAEACILPACMSLLADYFDRDELPRAASILLVGPFVGGGLALIFGGLLLPSVEHGPLGAAFPTREPWQLTFIAVGAPGLLVACLMFAVREPRRRGVVTGAPVRLREVMAFVWQERAFYFRFLCGTALLYVSVYTMPAWTPAMLMRAFGASAQTVGVQYGSVTLVAATIGILSGPSVSQLLGRRYPVTAPMFTAFLAGALAAAACVCVIAAPGYWPALAASAAAGGFLNVAVPVTGAALQAATPNRMRGVLTAIYAVLILISGVGIAPTVVAMITDQVLGDPAQLGLALGWISAGSAVASLPLLLGAARPFELRIHEMYGEGPSLAEGEGQERVESPRPPGPVSESA